MLSPEEQSANKERFLGLLDCISRDGARIDLLKKQLCVSDFFSAPASAKYHGAYEGGLCEHCLKVYDNLKTLNKAFSEHLDEEEMIVVALLHDFSKMNFYTSTVTNKKTYCETGKKHDSMGNFDWVSVPGYCVRDVENRLIIGSHEEQSVFMLNKFIPLSISEYIAVLHHHAGMSWDSSKSNHMEVFARYPLAKYLHMADFMDATEDEQGAN